MCPMPKAHKVSCYRQISDPQKLAAYAKLSRPALTPFRRSLPRARYRHGGIRARTQRAHCDYRVSEFGEGNCRARSAAYGEALKALDDGAVRLSHRRGIGITIPYEQ